MISATPVAAASEADGVLSQIHVYVANARAIAADGLTWAEFGELMTSLMRLTIKTLDAVSGLTGPQKKELVLQGVGMLFDVIADKCVPLLAWPFWVFLRSPVRSLVVAIAAGAIETLLPLVRTTA